MKHKQLQVVTLLILASFLFTGCQNMSPEQKAAIVGTAVGAATGVYAYNRGSSAQRAAAIGLGVGAATAAAVYYVAKRRATAAQRKVAYQRAMTYERRLTVSKKKSSTTKSRSSSKPKSAPKPKSRYVAVETPRDSRSVGSSSVMLWDTQADKLVNTNVYDLRSKPRVGSVATYDEYRAVYVADGD